MIPPLVNTFIGFFKDTSLVLHHRHLRSAERRPTGARRSRLGGFASEVYLFVAFVYFIFCFSMSRYSQYLEIELNKGHTPLTASQARTDMAPWHAISTASPSLSRSAA